MTKARLPETDLARIAHLPVETKWRLLRNMRAGHSPITYRPARVHAIDAFDIQRSLPMIVASPTKEQLLSAVRAACRTEKEADANAQVVGLIYDFVRENGITAVAEEFAPLRLAPGYSATYWTNAILRWGDRLIVLNTDFRRGAGYSPEGRRFSISAAHQRIRMLGSEYEAIELGILRFPSHKDGSRSIQLVVPQVDLLSFEQLEEMTAETLSIWASVCEERAAETRANAANDDGPLFGALGDSEVG